MKKTLFITAVAATALLSSCDKLGGGSAGELKTDNQKFAYSLGVDIGRNIEKGEFDSLDIDAMVVGIKDVVEKKNLKISDEESKKIVMEFLKKKQDAQMAAAVTKGKKFLEENAKKPGVTTTESGLQYQIMKAGNGPKPTVNDQVVVNYHGTLLDGRVFDSSVERGEPAVFPVGGVISGWTEALTLMPVGSKWKLFIPAKLAYGERGAGGAIGPNETLVFEVELISIAPKK